MNSHTATAPQTAPAVPTTAPAGPLGFQRMRAPESADPLRQRSLVGATVLGLHVLAGAGLLWFGLTQVAPQLPEVLSVRWITPEKAPEVKAPPTPKVSEKQPTPPKPQVQQPVTPPVIAAAVEAPAPIVVARQEETPPPAAPAPSAQTTTTAPVAVARPSLPAEPQLLNPTADCPVRPAPIYPQTSLKLGEEGKVILRAQADEKGFFTIVEILTSSGYGRLDRAARDIVKQSWQCKVQHSAGNWVKIPVTFSLE
ncbi:TonB family protein [Viridibacterium curvum]|uniref:TonB C-terminal domain-containing protein n=1 Tax=Viridibacterium curvum TaxID=1101404 RepID=A0ABP9R4Z1_9RHOO